MIMKSNVHVFLAVVLLVVCGLVEGGYDCIDHCSCVILSTGKYSADCSAKNLTDIPLPKGYQVDIINLDFNKIEFISKNAFMRYTSLEDVRLSGNRIRSIEEEAFMGLGRSNLKRLDLSLNHLLSVPVSEMRRISHSIEYLSFAFNGLTVFPNVLSEMSKLKELDISHNSMISSMPRASLPASLTHLNIAFTSIKRFDKRSFHSTSNLQDLRISDNFASGAVQFEEGTFDSLTNLRHLDLSRCFCRRLPPTSFIKLSNLSTLLLQKSYLRSPPVFSVDIPSKRGGDGQLNVTKLPTNPVDIPLDGTDQLLNRRKRGANDSVDPALDVTPEAPKPVQRWYNPNLKTLDLSQNRRLKFLSTAADENPIFPPALINLDLESTYFNTLRTGDLANLKRLQHLDLCSSQMKTILPGALSALQSLKSLCLSSNPLTQPPDIPRSVEEINMTNTGVTTLTRGFLGNLTNMVTLDFSKGNLRSVEDGSFEHVQQLRLLNLSSNSLQKVGVRTLFIGNKSANSSLLHVDLSHNNIAFLADLAFVSHVSLMELLLNGNDLTEVTERSLVGLFNLKILDLSRNSLIDVAPRALRDLRTVEEIRLNSNELEVIYPEQFSLMTSLVRLDLTDNRLLVVHKQNFPSLLNLAIHSNNLTDFPVLDAPVLTDLDASRNKFGKIDAGSLTGLPQLLRLDLRENENLRFTNYSVLAEAPLLSELNLADCDVHMFIDVVLPSLKVLLCSRNSIVAVTAPVENQLPSIQRLDLSFNNLTTLSATVFNQSHTLQSLDVTGNNFHCDCDLATFVSWVNEQNKHDLVDVVGSRGYLCESPPRYFAHRVLETVSGIDCNKPPDPRPSNGPQAATVAMEVIFGGLTAAVVAISVAVACYCRRRMPQNSSSASLSSVGPHLHSPSHCCDRVALHLCGGHWSRTRGDPGDEERDLMSPTPTQTPTDTTAPVLL